MSHQRRLAAGVLLLATLAVFLPAARYPFVMYDDPVYVTENQHVLRGLDWAGVRWALTSGDESNWHPLTWLSHMVDVSLFGVRAGPHHAVSALLHAINAALLLLVLCRMTGDLWRSAFAASLFALHPLRVESVAWIAERKDVLSGLFLLLATAAYLRYVRRPAAGRYLLVVAAFCAALLSKPTAVTFPLLMLVLDFWPLGRLVREQARRAVLEKVPLLALAVVVSLVTYVVQERGGAIALLGPVAFGVRFENALTSTAAYLGKLFWPSGLAVIYPYRSAGPGAAQLAVAVALLAGITALAAWQTRRRPYLLAGWIWYLVALLPTIGIVQAGAQSMADRYTYIPAIGVVLAVVWGAADLLGAARAGRVALVAGGAAVLVALATLTSVQLRTWRSDEVLFAHAIAVTRGNFIAENNLGIALGAQGRFAEAAAHHREAIRLRPDWSEAWKFHSSLGYDLEELGRFDEAIQEYREVLRLVPHDPRALNDIGIAMLRKGDLDGSVRHLASAVREVPGDAQLRFNYAVGLEMQGRDADAIEELERALQLRPGDPDFTARLARLRAGQPRKSPG